MGSKSSLTLCDPVDCSLPGSSVNGIFQAKTMEWVAILQGIFPTQEPNPCLLHLLHWQAYSLPLPEHPPPGQEPLIRPGWGVGLPGITCEVCAPRALGSGVVKAPWGPALQKLTPPSFPSASSSTWSGASAAVIPTRLLLVVK